MQKPISQTIISKAAWSPIHLKALDVANAAMRDDFLMVGVYTEQMLNLLDELEEQFGVQPAILTTRADYLDDPAERRRFFEEALLLARKLGDREEEAEILDSLETEEE
jgi:hypothetical protein